MLVVDQLVRVYAQDPDDVRANPIVRAQTGMELAAVSAGTGMLAGRLGARHYHRERMAVGLAGCVATAAALATESALATADLALASLIRAVGGRVRSPPGHCSTTALVLRTTSSPHGTVPAPCPGRRCGRS